MNPSLKDKNSVVILHGVLDPKSLDHLNQQNLKEVFVMEGRPSLEAAQRNSAELIKRKIIPVLIADNMAGFLFFKGLVKEVICAYQMADKEGAICDIGALILGVLARNHQVPLTLFPSGRKSKFIGSENELVHFKNNLIAPKGVRGYVPLVEWVPSSYITKVN